MAKPTLSLARWADGGGANITAPSSGTRDTGFQGGTPALSGQVNALLNQHYLWASYLDAGALEGTHSISGHLTLSAGMTMSAGPMVTRGIVTPGANLPTGSTNDYNPTGLASACILRLAADAGAVLTGLVGGSSGRTITLLNVGVNDLEIANDDGIGSTAANRFSLAGLTLGVAGTVTVRKNGSIALWYDAITARWRVLYQNL